MAKGFTVYEEGRGSYRLAGELSIHGLEGLREFLDALMESGDDMISISLAELRFADTAALQLLVAFKKKLAPGMALQLCALSPEIEHILSLSGLTPMLL